MADNFFSFLLESLFDSRTVNKDLSGVLDFFLGVGLCQVILEEKNGLDREELKKINGVVSDFIVRHSRKDGALIPVMEGLMREKIYLFPQAGQVIKSVFPFVIDDVLKIDRKKSRDTVATEVISNE